MAELIKPGTCIQLVNLTGESAKFNIQFGLIKKYLPEQRKYRVMLGHEKSDIAVSRTKFTIVQECQNETKENRTGFLLWPAIPQEKKPSLQWFDGVLSHGGKTKNILDLSKLYNDWEKEMEVFAKQKKPWMPPNQAEHGQLIALCHLHLGWPLDKIRMRRSWSHESPTLEHREFFTVLYNHENQTRKNIWYEKCFQPFLTNDMVVKGPIVVFRWFNKNKPDFQVSLNFHRSNLLGIRDFVEKPAGQKPKKAEFIKTEMEKYEKGSNLKSTSKDFGPGKCCIVENCECTKMTASGNKRKFLQESTALDRITAQFERFEGLKGVGTRKVFGDINSTGIQGIQEVCTDRFTGEIISPEEQKERERQMFKDVQKNVQDQCKVQ